MASTEEMAYTDFRAIAQEILDGSMTADEFAASGKTTGYDIFFTEPRIIDTLADIGRGATGEAVVRPNSTGIFNPDFNVHVHTRTDDVTSSDPQPSTVEWAFRHIKDLGHGNIQERGINDARLIIGFWKSYPPRKVRNG